MPTPSRSAWRILLCLCVLAPAHAAWSQANFLVYTDSLVNGWQNWSWATVNTAATSPVHSGSRSISVNAEAYQALYLEIPAFDTTTYSSLTFWINGGSSGGQLLLVTGLINGNAAGSWNLPALTANSWQQITVPLNSIGVAANGNFDGFYIQDRSGNTQPVFYLDDIALVGAAAPAAVHISVNAAKGVRTVDARIFGVNTAVWDSQLDTPGTITLLTAMGKPALRFPGGSLSDEYNWQTGQSNGTNWSTNFDNFVQVAAGAQSPAVFITVNYGSGTAAEAAAWVTYSNVTEKNGFKYWEIGNELYGTWETDHNNRPHDPYTYATLFQGYLTQMKEADPTIKIGAVADVGEDSDVNYTDHPATNPRTGQVHNGWTPVMLATMKSLGIAPDFLIYHNYGAYEGDAGLMQQAAAWGADAANLRQQLSDYLGSSGSCVELVSTENNCAITSGSNPQSTSLVNGLYYADSLGQILQTEFNARIWWDFRNGQTPVSLDPTLYGWRAYADDGMVYDTGTPANCYPVYYCGKLMSHFAAGGDLIVSATSDYQLLAAYAAQRAGGSLSVLVINKSPGSTLTGTIALTGFTAAPNAAVYSYGMTQDNAAESGTGSMDIAQTSLSTTGTSFVYTFPPYSATVLSLEPPLSITASGTLASGTYGALFSQMLSATGGTPGYSWIVSSGTLPPGLSLSGSGLLSGTPSSVGTYTFTAGVTDSVSETASATLTLAIQNIPFATWVTQNFSPSAQADAAISGPAADPEGDGMPNLLEYALSRNPNVPDAGGGISYAIEHDNTSGNNYFTLTYKRRKAPRSISYYTGVSGDLANWYEDAGHIEDWIVTDDGDGLTETVTVRPLEAVTGTNCQFLRLRVTEP